MVWVELKMLRLFNMLIGWGCSIYYAELRKLSKSENNDVQKAAEGALWKLEGEEQHRKKNVGTTNGRSSNMGKSIAIEALHRQCLENLLITWAQQIWQIFCSWRNDKHDVNLLCWFSMRDKVITDTQWSETSESHDNLVGIANWS